MRRLFSLVALSSLAAAMALAAVPQPAAAATEARVNFDLTVNGPSPSGDSLQLFLTQQLQKTGQIFPYCAPHYSPQRLQGPILPCQGGGTTYSATFSSPSGTTGSYRFEDVSVDGTVTVLKQGTFAYPAGPEGVQLTINATFNVGTMPNTAMAPRADASEAVLPALGIFLVLLAAALLAGSARRRQRAFDASGAQISER